MQRKFKFTEASVIKHAIPPDADALNGNGKPLKDLIYWDSEMPGFGLRVGRPRSGQKPARTFILQKDIHSRTRRVTIGRWPTWRVDEARRRAREVRVR